MNQKAVILGLFSCILGSYAAAQEAYWTQTFEENIPEKSAVETALSVEMEGQGEWIFYKAFQGTNTSYIKDGSAGSLRLPKSVGAYVVTPVVSDGVGRVTFNEGRGKRSLKVYASKDGGQTWTVVKEFSKNTAASNTVSINDADVNRVKLENSGSSGDADVDNLTLYPYDPNGTGAGDNPQQDNGVAETFWCAPDGNDETGDGTEQKPYYSLQKAADQAGPDDTIMMRAGTYYYNARVNISRCGAADKPITLKCADGRAVLDFSQMPYHKHSDNPQQGIRLTGSYWHLYRIDICNASDNGLLIERESAEGYPEYQGHHNVIEQCNFYRNGDTGLQMKNLASHNYVLNCDSYLNCDEGEGDADGFAPKISVGDGNYFYGCRAWLNSDDGWDVFYKKESGLPDDVCVYLENCVTYKNGFLDEDRIAPDGNGNGFKMGSNQGAMNMYLNRCLAVCNKSKGFDQNHNAGDIIMNNCTGMTLTSIGSKAYSYRIYEEIASGHEVRLTNCIAINDNDATDKRDKEGNVKPTEHGKRGEYGRFEVDETLAGLSVVSCEFQKADPTQFLSVENHAELMAARTADGELPYSTFARLKEGSSLIDKGTKIEATRYRGVFDVPALSYEGNAPDLGAYESSYTGEPDPEPDPDPTVDPDPDPDPDPTVDPDPDPDPDPTVDPDPDPDPDPEETAISTVNAQHQLTLQRTEGGLLLLTVSNDGTRSSEPYVVTCYDASGRQTGRQQFYGVTTALRLPYSTFVVRVTGRGLQKTVKLAPAVK